jgi:hypothetical protein
LDQRTRTSAGLLPSDRARALPNEQDRKRGQVMDKCRFCGLRGLVLSTANADYSCEHCGEWQEAILGSAWEITGYKLEEASK